MSKFIYKAFEYDSSVIDYEAFKQQLIDQGWQDTDPSDLDVARRLTIGTRLNTHRDVNIETIVMKRERQELERGK